MPTLFFDVTDVVDYARHNSSLSGIQRVVVEVISRHANSGSAGDLKLIRYDSASGEVLYYRCDLFRGDYRYDQARFCRFFGVPLPGEPVLLGDFVRSRYSGRWQQRWHYARNIVGNVLTRGRRFRERRIAWPPAIRAKPASRVDADPGAGDTIFIPGATWGLEPYLAFLKTKRTKGACVVQFIHDLIPLAVPEYVGNGVPQTFFRWLHAMSDIANLYLANSEWTRRDLIAFQQKTGFGSQACHVIPLAHEFPAPRPDPSKTPAGPKTVFLTEGKADRDHISARTLNVARLPFVLCVGTIESRKNGHMLARVWHALHQRLGWDTPRLVFAGKIGWQTEDFDAVMRGSGGSDGLIVVLERPSDADLGYLYGACLFSVYVSAYEGWGLPIGESLWFGKTVVSASTSSMPEVGGDMVAYVDPHDPRAMLETVERMIVDAPYRAAFEARISRDRLRSWSMVADDIMAELGRVTAT